MTAAAVAPERQGPTPNLARLTDMMTPRNGASEVEIDRMFGWNEAAYRKVMQLHYAGRDERVKRAKITSHV